MADATLRDEPQIHGARTYPRKLILITAAVCAAIVAAAAVLLSQHWPFSEKSVLQNLQETTDSQVRIRGFRETFFPSPGCVLEGVIFKHGATETKPLVTVEKLTVQGTYLGLLSYRLRKVVADGVRVSIPAFGTGAAFHTTKIKITIAEFVANGAEIDFAFREQGKEPLRFDIHEARLRELGWGNEFSYRIRVHNPEPPGEVSAEGKFGGWNEEDTGETPISGEYTFQQADLSVYQGIAGMLFSTGKFSGKLRHVDISGTTDVPDFKVKTSTHPVRLTAQFGAYVDAMHGDTFLQHVDADFRKTHLVADGSIAKSANGKGKTAIINLRSNSARIEDLLLLFIQAKQSPMSGQITFQTRAEIPPGSEEFLKKVKLRGEFGVGGGTFSNATTQKDVDKLSAGARGDTNSTDPGVVLTNLKGREELSSGTVSFNDITFHIPGAGSRLHGTYSLIDERIDLRGQMRVDTEISNTQTGVKSLALKVIQPFFKRKKKGQIVPVRIGGTYDHPTFGLDLRDKRAQLKPLHPADNQNK